MRYTIRFEASVEMSSKTNVLKIGQQLVQEFKKTVLQVNAQPVVLDFNFSADEPTTVSTTEHSKGVD